MRPTRCATLSWPAPLCRRDRKPLCLGSLMSVGYTPRSPLPVTTPRPAGEKTHLERDAEALKRCRALTNASPRPSTISLGEEHPTHKLAGSAGIAGAQPL